MAVELVSGPRYLDKNKLYGLRPGEQVILSQMPKDYSPGWKNRRISKKEIGVSPEFNKAHQEAVETAKRIETSPRVDPIAEGLVVMSSEQELLGCFRDLRVEVMRDAITGHRIKGFTLIGVPR